MADKPEGKDLARKIWLAGIGAYGRAFTEAKGAIDEVTGKGSKVFDDLVNKGEMIETVGKYKGKEMLGKAQKKVSATTHMPDLEIDDRIAKMRARLSEGLKGASLGSSLGSNWGSGSDVEKLRARVEQLEAKLDAILMSLDLENAPASKPRKAAVKTAKAPSKKRVKTQKVTAPKPVTAEKTATKKSATKKAPNKKTSDK